MSGLVSVETAAGTVNLAAPLVLASLAGVVSERSGVVNIALEGIMLCAAFASVAVTHAVAPDAQSAIAPWIGVAAAAAAGVAVALLHGLVVVRVRANQIISGVALNILAVGLTQMLCFLVFRSSSNSAVVARLPQWGAGRFLYSPLVWIAFALVPAVWFALRHTVFGLRLRAVGERPEAADTLGVRPARVRYQALALSGALAGLGGAALSADVSQFVQNMTAGRGYIALAAMIFGKWNPLGAAAACLLFAAADKAQIALQTKIPPQFAQSLPYLLTILVLAGLVGRARPPEALGRPYAKTD
jgi:simple sugar transport system permease protein